MRGTPVGVLSSGAAFSVSGQRPSGLRVCPLVLPSPIGFAAVDTRADRARGRAARGRGRARIITSRTDLPPGAGAFWGARDPRAAHACAACHSNSDSACHWAAGPACERCPGDRAGGRAARGRRGCSSAAGCALRTEGGREGRRSAGGWLSPKLSRSGDVGSLMAGRAAEGAICDRIKVFCWAPICEPDASISSAAGS